MTSLDYITHEEIRTRARELWERAGRPQGRDEQLWLDAENELRGEREQAHPSDEKEG